MMNIKYKVLSRISIFGEDNINTNSQYQYPLGSNPTIINAIRLRFNFNGNLGSLNLSRSARISIESCCIPSLVNASGKYAILRLITPTEDKCWDSKKTGNGNPIILVLSLSSTDNAANTIYNASENFYNINIPHNLFSNGVIDMELEVPNATTSIDFLTGTPLKQFFINFIITDVDRELTQDLTLAPPLDYKTYNINFPIKNNF